MADDVKIEDPKKNGSKGRVNAQLFDPESLFVVGLDGEPHGLDEDERKRIAALPKGEQLAALAPYKIDGLRERFAGNDTALALVDALIDDRATQPLDDGFVASCRTGVHEPIIATNLGTAETPLWCVVEGRQRVRALRLANAERLDEHPPAPPYSMLVIARAYASAKKAREVKIATSNHVALTPIQRARRAQELLDDNIAPADVAPLVGCTSTKALKELLALTGKDASVQSAIEMGTLSAASAKELRHLSLSEQAKRVAQIAEGGFKGRRAAEVARTGKSTALDSKAPARVVVDNVAKRLIGSNDPLLRVAGTVMGWATTGGDAGLKSVPNLKEIIDEELIKYHGEAISSGDRERLLKLVTEWGGEKDAAVKLGINPVTLSRAIGGLKVKARVRAAILAAIKDEPKAA